MGFSLVSPVYAACNSGAGSSINLADCLLLSPGGQSVGTVYSTPADLLNVVVPNLFVAAGVFLFVMILFAGFKFAMSPDSKDKGDAKDLIKNALIGFGIMFGAYWIVRIIEVIVGTDILL